jgi:hypothetical protein
MSTRTSKDWEEVVTALVGRVAELENVIDTIKDVAEDRADVSDEKPNAWMQVLVECEAILK